MSVSPLAADKKMVSPVPNAKERYCNNFLSDKTYLCIRFINFSFLQNSPIPKNMVIMGEVGLTGEVRRINLIEKRLKEAERLGFKSCIIPESNKKDLKDKYKLDIIGVVNVNEAMKKVLG